MKIAILGGSFDPPHIEHALIARQVIEKAGIDQVWLMPNYSTSSHHEIFQKEMSSPEKRLAMARLLEDKAIKVSDFEINHNKESITIVTLEMLEKQHPEHTFYWITGSDKLETFQKYDRWKDIVKNHKLIIFPREIMLPHLEEKVKTCLDLQTIPENVIVLHNDGLVLSNVSSSMIRKRLREGLSITYLVPNHIEEYIKENNLYGA